MNNMDIYRNIGNELIADGYYVFDFNQKKELVIFAIKNYLYQNIIKMNPNYMANNKNIDESSIKFLINVYSILIPEENRINMINNFTHFLLSIMSELQSCSIKWIIDDNILQSSFIEKNNRVDYLVTKEFETVVDAQNIFLFTMDYFSQEFKNKLTLSR